MSIETKEAYVSIPINGHPSARHGATCGCKHRICKIPHGMATFALKVALAYDNFRQIPAKLQTTIQAWTHAIRVCK